jgi:hypothetical protein
VGRRVGGALALVLLLAGAGYLFYPIREHVEGTGVLLPVADFLIPVQPETDGVVSRVHQPRLALVARGTDLFTVIVPSDAGVGSAVIRTPRMTPAIQSGPWTRGLTEARRRGGALDGAGRGWKGRVQNARERATWEPALAERLATIATRSGELLEAEVRNRAREEREHPEGGRPPGWQGWVGTSLPTGEDRMVVSPEGGTLISLWAAPLVPVTAGVTLAEIMPEGAPLEILTVMPAGVAAQLQRVRLQDPALSPMLSVTSILVGRVPINPGEAELLLPGLSLETAGVITRMRLEGRIDARHLNTTVRYMGSTPARPRVWQWIAGGS